MKKTEFSKALLIQESLLIWVISLAFIGLAYISVIKGYTGTLPWLAAMASCPWAAYGVSQAFYYKKAEKENVLKIQYEIPEFDQDEMPEEDYEN